MEKKADEIHDDDRLKNLPVQTENLAFKPEEMIACGACRRTNPPNRLKCFYCGAELEIGELQTKNIKPNLRKLEIWEKGYNLIYQPDAKDFSKTDLAEIAKLVNLESEILEKICKLKTALPIARIESEKEAEIVQKRLKEFGFETSVLSDEKLSAKNPPKRLRGLEFWDDKLILIFFNTDEIAEIALADLILIVTGAIFERRTESVEKRKKGENKLLKATETSSDEMLFDIYARENPEGFRIFAKGFDFSCLEAEKEILAKDNLRKLTEKLKSVAPNARLVENYLTVRESLGSVWVTDEINDSKGLTRQSFGKFNLENITTISNWTQFNKFSRLQFHNL
jgi:hypothetical protein